MHLEDVLARSRGYPVNFSAVADEAARPPANLHGTNPTALSAAQGLCAAGGAATPALVELLADGAAPWLLHVYVLDALGLQGAPALGAAAAP